MLVNACPGVTDSSAGLVRQCVRLVRRHVIQDPSQHLATGAVDGDGCRLLGRRTRHEVHTERENIHQAVVVDRRWQRTRAVRGVGQRVRRRTPWLQARPVDGLGHRRACTDDIQHVPAGAHVGVPLAGGWHRSVGIQRAAGTGPHTVVRDLAELPYVGADRRVRVDREVNHQRRVVRSVDHRERIGHPHGLDPGEVRRRRRRPATRVVRAREAVGS